MSLGGAIHNGEDDSGKPTRRSRRVIGQFVLRTCFVSFSHHLLHCKRGNLVSVLGYDGFQQSSFFYIAFRSPEAFSTCFYSFRLNIGEITQTGWSTTVCRGTSICNEKCFNECYTQSARFSANIPHRCRSGQRQNIFDGFQHKMAIAWMMDIRFCKLSPQMAQRAV